MMLEDKGLDENGWVVGDADTARSTTSEPGSAPETVARERAPQRGPAVKAPDPAPPASPPPAKAVEPKPAAKERAKGLLRHRTLIVAIGVPFLLVAVAAGYLYLDYTRHFESTDDAFIAARQTSLAPKVSGYIVAVPVSDNDHVSAGQVIAQLDDRDYRVALAQTQAQVDAAQASIDNIDAQLDVQQAQIAANQAQVDQAQAALVFAHQQASRYQSLQKTGYGTVQNSQQATSQLHQQQAALLTSQANLNLAQRQIAALKAQRKTAQANLAQAEAQHDQAELNLSYTKVVAAQPGRVVNLSAAVGQFAQPGTNLSMFVPDQIWVTANFKEVQLDHMRPGEVVTLRVDAYPERKFHGHVDSVQPGSGTAFSLLPAQNATGNYVKIVQRVPVKIVVDDLPADVALGPGMSVEPNVRIDSSLSLIERLGRLL